MRAVADSLDAINTAIASALRWLVVIMVFVQFGIVLGRYVFGVNSIAMQESVLYLHATFFMLGAGYTLLVDGQVRVDIFYAKCSERTQAWIDLFGHLFLLTPALILLIWFSWPYVRGSWAIMEGPISVGGIPASYLLKSLIPAYCVLLLVQGIAAFIRDVVRLKGTEA